MERLSSLARLTGPVSERSGDSSLVNTLVGELQNAYLDGIVDAMEHSGVLAALDESPEITFGEIRRSAIPAEDVQFLRRAGVEDPDAEITLIVHYSRKRFRRRQEENPPSEIAHRAQTELRNAGAQIQKATSKEEDPGSQRGRRKRKLFNGIGKILAGTITGGGNLLLAVGTIAAPNPATAYGVIASSALAVGGICQGIGDLRGE